MAWIMKNSAGTVIDRREEPYFDDAMKQQLEDELMPKYPTRRAATLPVLHAIQAKFGYLPYQAIEEAAAFLETTPAEVLDTASFYDQYQTEPQGRYTLWVCHSLSCELMGQPDLLKRVQAKLGVGPGETTDDGKFTLRTAECLGSCGTAPCALVNDVLHETIDADAFEKALEELE